MVVNGQGAVSCPKEDTSLKSITIGSVGTSWITESFISAIAGVKNLSLSAVYSRDSQKAKAFAEKHHAEKYYSDMEAMAQDPSIDAIYIASPNFLHHTQTMQFLKAGKHVICEKPLASNYQEAKEMIETARENHVVLLEAMRTAYDPGLSVIRDNLYKMEEQPLKSTNCIKKIYYLKM